MDSHEALVTYVAHLLDRDKYSALVVAVVRRLEFDNGTGYDASKSEVYRAAAELNAAGLE